MPLQLVESGTLPLQSFRMAALEASSIMLASDQPAPRAWHAARAAGQVDRAVCPAYTGAVEIGEAEGEGEDTALLLGVLERDGVSDDEPDEHVLLLELSDGAAVALPLAVVEPVFDRVRVADELGRASITT